MVQVNVEKIKDFAGKTIRLQIEVPPHEMKDETGEVIVAEPLRLELALTGNGFAILAEGTVKANVQLSCARCLKPFTSSIEAPFHETYYPAGSEQVNHEDKYEWVPFKNQVIDLKPEILRSILLMLPMKAVCSQDCRGLCQTCGHNLNNGDCNCERELDPRMAVLQDLFQDKKI